MLPLVTQQQKRDLEWHRLLESIDAVETPITAITHKSKDWVAGRDEGYELGIKVGIEAQRNGATSFFSK